MRIPAPLMQHLSVDIGRYLCKSISNSVLQNRLLDLKRSRARSQGRRDDSMSLLECERGVRGTLEHKQVVE
jgi:antitoxin component of MazEF toxin-antitoxin module